MDPDRLSIRTASWAQLEDVERKKQDLGSSDAICQLCRQLRWLRPT